MILLALGLAVGLSLALTGAGGSILAVPMLMFGMGWTLTQAGPVALLAVASSAAIGTVMGLRARLVRYRAAALMAAAGAITTPLGLYAAQRLPLKPLTLVFAALLAWIGIRLLRQARAPLRELSKEHASSGQAPCLIDPATGRFRWTRRCAWAISLSGLGTGLLSGLFGVGGGFIIVPSMRRATELPMNAIIATSMMVITLVASWGVLSAGMAGHLPGLTAAPFAAGAIAGMLGGRKIAARIAGPKLQQGFAVLTIVISFIMAARQISA